MTPEQAYTEAQRVCAKRYALRDRLKRERAARAEWPFLAALAVARGAPAPERPPRRTRAQECAENLAADRDVIAAWKRFRVTLQN